jgi:hypothetical protein
MEDNQPSTSNNGAKKTRDKEIQEKIRQCLQTGQIPAEIFLSLQQDYCVRKADLDRITEWFRQAEENGDTSVDYGLDVDQHTLCVQIIEKQWTVRNGIAVWPFWKDGFQFLDSRYALCLRQNSSILRLILLDNFHGQER